MSLVNRTGAPRTIASLEHELLPARIIEERILPSRALLSPEQELEALWKERQEYLMAGRHSEWPVEKEARRQQLLRQMRNRPDLSVTRLDAVLAGPARGDVVQKTGVENSPTVKGRL